MTVSELDRLVSQTEMNPSSKNALKVVRSMVMKGMCGDAEVGRAGWSVAIDTLAGRPVRMSFSFKRVQDG